MEKCKIFFFFFLCHHHYHYHQLNVLYSVTIFMVGSLALWLGNSLLINVNCSLDYRIIKSKILKY